MIWILFIVPGMFSIDIDDRIGSFRVMLMIDFITTTMIIFVDQTLMFRTTILIPNFDLEKDFFIHSLFQLILLLSLLVNSDF